MEIEIRGPCRLKEIEEDVKIFLKNDAYLPFYYVPGLRQAERLRVLLKRISDVYCCIAKKNGTIIGLAAVRERPFDNDIFGLKSGHIVHMYTSFSYKDAVNIYDSLTDPIMRWLHEAGITFIHARVDMRNIALLHALERAGFRIVATNVMHICDTKSRSAHPAQPVTELEVTECRTEEKKAVCDIAAHAYDKNRFAMDPRISSDQSSALYRRWTEGAFVHPHKRIVVARRKGEVVGYLIGTIYAEENILLSKSIGAAELGAVRHDIYGNKVMMAMTKGLMDVLGGHIHFAEAYMAVLNRSIISIYTNAGFTFQAAQYDLHFWDEKG